MRRITDMGRQFSKSRFQILVFDIIQEFLSDDGSIYYAMTENLLQQNFLDWSNFLNEY